MSEQGYVPAKVTLRAGIPARITFVRTTDKTCDTEVVLPSLNIKRALPLNEPVVIEFTPAKSGGDRVRVRDEDAARHGCCALGRGSRTRCHQEHDRASLGRDAQLCGDDQNRGYAATRMDRDRPLPSKRLHE